MPETLPSCTILRLLSEQRLIPTDRGGVYFLRMRFPSDYELGVYEGVPSDLSRVISLCSGAIERAVALLIPDQLEGTLHEQGKASHLKVEYRVGAGATRNHNVKELVEVLLSGPDPYLTLSTVLEMLRHFFNQLPPVYVGMTSQQSLADRLEQHLSGTSGLAERLAKHRIDWNELWYGYMPLEGVESTEMRALEKMFQMIIRPPLSFS